MIKIRIEWPADWVVSDMDRAAAKMAAEAAEAQLIASFAERGMADPPRTVFIDDDSMTEGLLQDRAFSEWVTRERARRCDHIDTGIDIGRAPMVVKGLKSDDSGLRASLKAASDELARVTKTDRQVRAGILAEAARIVTEDRAATHGEAEHSFARVAAVWSARLGVDVTPAQVALMMVELKVTRAWGNPGHADNWVDIAGYAACGGEVANGGE